MYGWKRKKLSRSELVSKISIVGRGLNKGGREWKIFLKFIVVGPSTSDPRELKFFSILYLFVLGYIQSRFASIL